VIEKNKDGREFKNQNHITVCVCVFVYEETSLILKGSDQTHCVLHWILQTTNYEKKGQTATYDHNIKMETRKQLNNSIIKKIIKKDKN